VYEHNLEKYLNIIPKILKGEWIPIKSKVVKPKVSQPEKIKKYNNCEIVK
jgi:hypothetical protein